MAVPGNVLVLTKPLGSKVSQATHQWLEANDQERLGRITLLVSETDIRSTYENSLKFKNTESSSASAIIDTLIKTWPCNQFVEVGELGILGHAQKLVENQEVDCLISNLPILAKMDIIGRMYENEFKLIQGYAPENLGGLLVCMSREHANQFVPYIRNVKGANTWIVGTIFEGNGSARMSKKPTIIEVTNPINL